MYILECTKAGTADFVFCDMTDQDEVKFRKADYIAVDGKTTRVLKRARVFATQREGKEYISGMDPAWPALVDFGWQQADDEEQLPMPKFKLVPVVILLK